ncbi:Lipase domain containing protein [Aphelenchoides fujianensis]|nr:Lipase domain containing protein [Aphelenchoides fujianensis]
MLAFFLSVFVLSIRGVHSVPFNEQLAKRVFIPLASAAYSPSPERCIENLFKNATLTKKVTVRCGHSHGEKRNCFAFTGVAHAERAIFLVYRGTNDGVQLFYEVQKTIVRRKVRSPIGGGVNAYFWSVYNKLNKWGIRRSMRNLVRKYPHYRVFVTGHSLGGGLAAIAAGELVGVERVAAERVVMLNFGQPRVGDREYALRYEKLLPFAYRVVHANDLVPHVPPVAFDGYQHFRNEIFYDNAMGERDSFVQCTKEDAEECAGARASPSSVLDHISYFQTMFFTYGIANCQTKQRARVICNAPAPTDRPASMSTVFFSFAAAFVFCARMAVALEFQIPSSEMKLPVGPPPVQPAVQPPGQPTGGVPKNTYTLAMFGLVPTLFDLLTLAATIVCAVLLFLMQRRWRRLSRTLQQPVWARAAVDSTALDRFCRHLHVDPKRMDAERDEFLKTLAIKPTIGSPRGRSKTTGMAAKKPTTTTTSTLKLHSQEVNNAKGKTKTDEQSKDQTKDNSKPNPFSKEGVEQADAPDDRTRKLEQQEGYETLDGLEGADLNTRKP